MKINGHGTKTGKSTPPARASAAGGRDDAAALDQDVIARLLASEEPAIRYKTRVNVLGEDPASGPIRKLREENRGCPRVAALLSERNDKGLIPHNPYSKWCGAHWVLSILADIGYPAGDKALGPLAEHVLDCWLSPLHIQGVRVLDGRPRRCASQESNALYSLLTLGLGESERLDQLAENLIGWQWPDGGWNCDRDPKAAKSSFHETTIGVRALALHGRLRKNKASLEAARRAAEIFLKRRMFRRLSDGAVMNAKFMSLHYPTYWHYDLLFGLKVMAEAGLIGDERCQEAIEVLKSKRLSDGGFPAEAKFYSTADERTSSGRPHTGTSRVTWGGISKRKMNEWVTVDALYVLKAARTAH